VATPESAAADDHHERTTSLSLSLHRPASEQHNQPSPWWSIKARITGGLAVAALAVTATALNDSRVSETTPQTDRDLSRSVTLSDDGTLVFPQDGAVPRSLTPAERQYVDENPLWEIAQQTMPPIGPLYTAAEYEPMDAVLVSYTGASGWKTVLDQMAANITTIGDADVIVIAPNQTGANEAQNRMSNAGADMDRVTILIQPTNSIWIRDYGPRYVYEGDVRVVVDHTYNRPRPLDNAIPAFLANHYNHGYYLKPLVHGGGNYHLDALTSANNPGGGYTTTLINAENPGYTEQQIHDIWLTFQNLTTTFFYPLPASVDATQHIDMWMQVIDDDKVIISTWPANPGSIMQQVCDAAADDFASRGFTVYRTPARVVGGTHYTYTNMVVVNDLVLLPSYTHSTISPYNSQALATVQSAVPDKTVVQINSQGIVTAAGVLHCVMKHVPAHRGDGSPTAYLRSPRGGEIFEAGDSVTIEWISDAVTNINAVDLHLSLDGGDTYDVVIAEGVSNSGQWQWTVPNLPSTEGRVRVLVHDAGGTSGSHESEGNFAIVTEAKPGDLDGNGIVDAADLLILLASWGPCPYGACCLGDGGCGTMSSSVCAAKGGAYQGHGATCDSADCQLPPEISCQGICGQEADSGCWCDELCCQYQDCCPDKHAVCGGCNPAGMPPADSPDECPADLNGDGTVDGQDLLILLANWG
jgi:agmatine deiminase